MFTAKFAFQEREQAGTGVASTLKCEIGSRRLAPGGTVTWIAWLRSLARKPGGRSLRAQTRRTSTRSRTFFEFTFFLLLLPFHEKLPLVLSDIYTVSAYRRALLRQRTQFRWANRLGTLTRYPPVVSIRRDAHLSRYLHERVANSTRISSEDRLFFNVKMKIGLNRAVLFSCWFTWYRWFCIVIYFTII